MNTNDSPNSESPAIPLVDTFGGKVAAAIQAELRSQGVLFEVDPANPDLTRLMMNTGEAADLPALVRAIMSATLGDPIAFAMIMDAAFQRQSK